jgi:hypothetical protein
MENSIAAGKGGFGLSNNQLKIIAMLSMLADHMGMILFPEVRLLRIVGRLAFPIFAFMIAEGCHHTKNRLRYILGVALLGLVCVVGYLVAERRLYFATPMSFTVAIGSVYLLQQLHRVLWKPGFWKKLLWGGAFLASVVFAYALARRVRVEYGFWGCMIPVAAALPRVSEDAPPWLQRLNCNAVRVLCMLAPMAMLIRNMGSWQLSSLLAVPLLLCYNGRRGKWRMKYFFYIFYPGHLVLLYGLRWLLRA